MKKIFSIIMLVSAMLLAACTSDDDYTSENNAGREMLIGVSMPEDESTRIALDDLTMTWEEGDQILVVPTDGNLNPTGPGHTFTLLEGAGTKHAKFKGFMPFCDGYVVYYKAKNLYYDQNTGKYDINYSDITQNGINSTEHFKDYALMSCQGYDFPMNYLQLVLQNGLLRIDLRDVPEELTTINTISWAITDKTEKIEMGKMTFAGEIKNLTSDAEHNYIYLPFSTMRRGGGLITVNPGDRMVLTIESDNVTAVVSRTTSRPFFFFSEGRYDVKVTADPTDEKAMNQWKIYAKGEGPAFNEIWVKFAEGAYKKQTIKDYNEYYVFTLSAEPNAEGWYVYSTESINELPIEKLFSSDNVGKNTIAEAWLPSSMTEVSILMFYGCSKLTNVILSPNTTVLKGGCFSDCGSLKNLIIPAKVTEINSTALSYFSENVTDNRITVMAHKETLTNIDPTVFYAANGYACDLYIHESWKEHITGNRWAECDFRSVHFINDEGIEVTEP